MAKKKSIEQLYDNYDEEVNSLIPSRELNKSIDSEAVRSEVIENEIELQKRREKAKLVKKLKRHQLRRNIDDDKKQQLKDAITKADANSPVIVIKEGEADLLGTTQTDVVKMLHKLNINLNMQLTRTDTMNLLATLLTCNDSQLTALSMNPKVPVVIKIIIKRLSTDMQTGDMDAIEKIWDRVFGKSGMNIVPPGDNPVMGGIIPNTPVSREAYMVIRDTYIGNH